MLLYIEACDAGSMFDDILSEDTNSKFYILYFKLENIYNIQILLKSFS